MNHHLVRTEIEPEEVEQLIVGEEDDFFAAILLEYREKKYDWASKTLHDLEKLNHASCSWLTEHGYNGVGLKA